LLLLSIIYNCNILFTVLFLKWCILYILFYSYYSVVKYFYSCGIYFTIVNSFIGQVSASHCLFTIVGLRQSNNKREACPDSQNSFSRNPSLTIQTISTLTLIFSGKAWSQPVCAEHKCAPLGLAHALLVNIGLS
jgi:hypothetical protein